ncbi:MAG TPA: cytochrome c3 family protein, partial [Gammaproteobacteria bacterium]|nr:cytochrome c3 family protein [Gammaproteobacteria bacterium]
NCTDCHSDINNIPHPQQLQPVDCGGCHRAIVHQLRLGMHAPGNKGVPACATCHGTHGIQKPDSVVFRNSIPETCGTCHKRHFQAYMDVYHGQAAALGVANAPRCSNCHNPHMPLPPDNPQSTIAPANLITTCGACHKDANANFVKFDPHPQPQNKAHSALVYYSKLFMELLLSGVFGFFGLHTVLWLQRSLVERASQEAEPKPPASGKYVRRFTPYQSWLHVLVVVSFIGLAVTGLPLKYASAHWAHILYWLLGGEPIMRTVHIICAAIFFGYFVVHIAVVFYLYSKSRDWRRFFWGVNSMVPRGQDIMDIFRNFRWFLYLGPKPKLDRWTYWEKFDYWAVFWGMVIIGCSGLMLRFPVFFSRVIPGEFLNVALVIHGEEALLAVGFIFVFHFFHNHFRPDKFPMNISIFTGRVPLETFMEERPAQYERMVAEGKLDSMIVGPPSTFLKVVSTLFGATAIILGLILIISLFVTIISSYV